MTKGLEALEEIKKYSKVVANSEELNIIEKELKALEIIKKKLSPLAKFTFYPMSQEEYELLKEVFND